MPPTPIWGNLAALAVAVIFYAYRAYLHNTQQRRKLLRERVAYMLWVMAERSDASGSRVIARC